MSHMLAGCYRLVISKKWVPAQSGTFILRGAGAETALDLEWCVCVTACYVCSCPVLTGRQRVMQ